MATRISTSLPKSPTHSSPGEPCVPRTAAKAVPGRHIFQRPDGVPAARSTVAPASAGAPRRAASAAALARSSAGSAAVIGPPSEPGDAEPASPRAASPARSHPASTSIDAPNQRQQAAQADVSHGYSVQQAAHRHGIGDPDAMAALNRQATLAQGLNAVRAGMPLGRAVVSLGISDPAHIQGLTHIAALRDSGDPRLQEAARRATLSHADECSALEQLAAHGPALKAVREGQPIYAVIEKTGISNPELTNMLKRVAVALAHRETRPLALTLDPADPQQLLALDKRVAHGPALAAVQNGEAAAQVIQHMGISSRMLRGDLQQVAALLRSDDPALRAHAKHLMLQPLTDPRARTHLADLERLATHGPAMAAVRAGKPAADVIAQMGISQLAHVKSLKSMAALTAFANEPSQHAAKGEIDTRIRRLAPRLRENTPGAIREIEDLATATAALAAVKAGQEPSTVARHMGIRNRDNIKLLKNIAALAARPEPTERGFAVHLTRTQVAHPGVVETIERRTTAGPGVAAVRSGESVRAVAKRMGIVSPGNLQRLEEVARRTSSPRTPE
jgi:transposase-like protein